MSRAHGSNPVCLGRGEEDPLKFRVSNRTGEKWDYSDFGSADNGPKKSKKKSRERQCGGGGGGWRQGSEVRIGCYLLGTTESNRNSKPPLVTTEVCTIPSLKTQHLQHPPPLPLRLLKNLHKVFGGCSKRGRTKKKSGSKTSREPVKKLKGHVIFLLQSHMVMIVMSRNICIKGVSKSMGPNWCINCQKRERRSSEYQGFDALARTPPDSRLTKDEYFDNKNDAMCSLFVQNVSWSGQVRLNKVNNFIWNCCNKQFSLKAQKSFAALIKQSCIWIYAAKHQKLHFSTHDWI